MARCSNSSRSLWAIGASLLLHGSLVTWLATRKSPPPASPPPTPLEVSIVHLPPSPPPPQSAPAPAPPRRPTRTRQPPPDLPIAQPLPPADRPLAAAMPTPQAVSLVPSSDFAVKVEDRDEPVPSLRQALPPSADQLVKDLVNESIGRGKVQRGLVHPYYAQLGKTLLKTWDADRAVSRKGLKGFSEQFAENSRVWGNIWQEKAAAFGASGSPLQADARGKDLPLRRSDLSSTPGAPDLAARAELRREMREQFKATRRAILKVVQDRSGALRSIQLVSPSNDPSVDKQAMADIRQAAEKLPAPPPEAYGRREELVSLWQFELVISISPPVPTFSFEFDEALGFVDARLPLDRRIYKRVRLLSVE